MFPSPAPEHPADPLKCLAFRGFCFSRVGKGVEKVSQCRAHLSAAHKATTMEITANATTNH